MIDYKIKVIFFFSSRRRHTRLQGDWSSDVCSSDLQYDTFRTAVEGQVAAKREQQIIDLQKIIDLSDPKDPEYPRSEERRVGEGGRSRGAPDHLKKKKKNKKSAIF